MKITTTLFRRLLAPALFVVFLSHAAGADKTQAALRSLYDQLGPFVSLSEPERAAIARRGPVAVYLPIGADDRGLVSELKQMKLDPLCVFVNDESVTSGALAGKSVLILPDLCEYESQPDRDRKIKDFLTNGGGVFAVGGGVRHLHTLGLFEAELMPLRARGPVRAALEGQNQSAERLPVVLGDAAPILKKAFEEKLIRDTDIFMMNNSFLYDGPLFRLPAGSSLTVFALMAVTEIPDNAWPTVPGMAYGAVGKGRLVILSGGRTGINSELVPVDAPESGLAEPTREDISNLMRPIVHKQLILYASGDPASPLRTKEGGK